ncbi:MAG: hypothetical protein II670_01525, partial [Alphaproteobacteria bacterium]|nr:hypothetical protein [Alphaproteobacteria bacterium]
MKTSAKIILLIFFMTVIVYKNVHSQNVYNDRLNYYNMDTTGCVSYGRWDPPDSILQARKEGRRFIYLPSEYVSPTYKRGDPLYTVSRGTIKLRELKIKNHKISRTIKKAIKKYRITPKLYDSDTSSNLSSEEKAKYIILPDSSGYFVS